jgi:steroid delta-isomerase
LQQTPRDPLKDYAVNTSTNGLRLENSPHTAQRAAALSARYASERKKAAWLDLYADDAILEDPVGVSPLDPAGLGHRGREALSRFWDLVIAPGRMRYVIRESYPCGDECANVWTLTNTLPGDVDVTVDLVSIYKVNALGKLAAMRAYWSYADVEQKLKAAIGPRA